MNITKEELSKVINNRFPRIANYLKQKTKSKTSNIILSITYTLHKIYLNTLTDSNTTKYILDYLESNYINRYINNTDIKTDISSIKEINNILTTKYINESDILNLNVEELITLLSNYEDLSYLTDLKENIINTYNIIKKEYKDIKIIN